MVDRCFHISAPLCDHCLVLGLLVATGLPNQITTATCAIAGISSSTEGHPRRSKIPLDFGVSSGPSTLNREIEICQVLGRGHRHVRRRSIESVVERTRCLLMPTEAHRVGMGRS